MMTTREPSALIRAQQVAALGCGSLAVAHQPNEWIQAADLAVAIDLAEALARAYAANRSAR